MQASSPSPTLQTTPTWPHALPYRVLFEEHRSRQGSNFAAVLQEWASSQADTVPDLLLSDAVVTAEQAYAALDQKHDDLRRASSKIYPNPEQRNQAIDAAHQDVQAAALACQTADAPLKRLLHLCSSSALCFSGGGIRSASFSLGVLQGLARFSLGGPNPQDGFLQKLQYLSTVSGGGYIGSWLMGWASRSNFSSVISELGKGGKTAGDPEPDPVRHLRDYTSFLAPRYGFTVDTATLAAIVLRNLFLNWIIFFPCLIALILFPRLLAMAGNSLAFWVISLPGAADRTLMIAAAVCIGVAGWIAAQRSSHPPKAFTQSSSIFRSETVFLAVTLLACWLVVEAWLAGWNNDPAVYQHFNAVRVCWLIGDLSIASLFMSVARLRRAAPGEASPFRVDGRHWIWGRLLWSFFAPVLVATVVALALEFFAVLVGPLLYGDGDTPVPLFHILALPIVVSLFMLGSALLSGLLSSIEYEEEREWWARAGGVFFIILLAWIGAEVVSWYAGYFVIHDPRYGTLAWGTGTAVFGGAAAAAGNSITSAAGPKHVDLSQLSRVGRFLGRNQLLAPALSLAALICIFLLVGSLNEVLLANINSTATVQALYAAYSSAHRVGDIHFFSSAYEVAIPILGVAAALIALLANFCINVNTFSLHGMYRMRLVRAFLGASNFGRDADRFTNFDRTDNVPQAELQSIPDAPIHVVNTALNLVDARKQAWQQRKAESFTFTPFQCGSWRLGYAATGKYGGLHGVTLGTAMAISGAAFNPNMGYNSSPLVTLVMTLFNARLGWWFPNPGWALHRNLSPARSQRYLEKSGPTFALASIVAEALGTTDDRRKWIQLSDGGHFENLALYEMVLRRCRCIVVVDAGADNQFQFEDLGNAIRKINIDLGIPITFSSAEAWPISNQKVPTDRYCAIGKIEYCCVDSADAPAGYLIYIKPQLLGHEPRDVTAYAAVHAAFPHESTANQFFNESQFESYRHLGSHAMTEILKSATSNTLDDLLNAALQYSGRQRFETPSLSAGVPGERAPGDTAVNSRLANVAALSGKAKNDA